MQSLKAVSYVFWAMVAVVVLSFAMSIYTMIKTRQEVEKSAWPQGSIPVPAVPATPNGSP